jgi:hypothetical protein
MLQQVVTVTRDTSHASIETASERSPSVQNYEHFGLS